MLSSLHLQNFRCHGQRALRGLGPRTALVADNGQGKTSILEAVYFLSRVRSFRTHQNRELIAWGQESCGVSAQFENEPECGFLKVEWSPNERRLAVDGKEGVSFREFWGRCPVTVFQNSDRQLVQGSGQVRRQWADSLLALVDPAYLKWIQSSQLLLKQKNALLRQDRPSREVWSALTVQLRELGRQIHAARDTFTKEAGPLLEQFYTGLTGRAERVQAFHEAALPALLEKSDDDLWRRETQTGLAALGPHRDDWRLELEGQPLRHYGSEGQQKSAALAMRHVEMAFVRTRRGRWPIVLVDDALNELDGERQEAFWRMLDDEAQMFLAVTRADAVPLKPGFEVRGLE